MSVGRTIVKGFRSLSNWEDSWYGGYHQVLWDHPEIVVDTGLQFENNNMGSLGWYTFNKLIKMFLLSAKKQKVINSLSENTTQEKINKWGKIYTRHHINQSNVEQVLKYLKTSNIELANMFDHYSDIISNTRFYYDVPEKHEENGGSSGKGNGDSEEDEDSDKSRDGKDSEEQQRQKQKEIQYILCKIFEEIDERKLVQYTSWLASGNGKTEWDILKPGKPCQYEDHEILQASQLVNLLDISFDPSEDRINSLKTGKLDTNKLGEIPSGNLNVYYRLEENISTKPFSVCVCIDESGSMNRKTKPTIGYSQDYFRLYYAQSMMKVLYKAFSQIIPQDKLFFYGHSGPSSPIISVYHDRYNQNFENTVSQVGKHQGNNYDSAVMEAIYNKIRGWTEDNIIFIIISDGEPCQWGPNNPISDMKRIIEKSRRDGFVTLGIGVNHPAVKHIYPYNTVIDDMEKEFVRKTSYLINRVVKNEFQN